MDPKLVTFSESIHDRLVFLLNELPVAEQHCVVTYLEEALERHVDSVVEYEPTGVLRTGFSCLPGVRHTFVGKCRIL